MSFGIIVRGTDGSTTLDSRKSYLIITEVIRFEGYTETRPVGTLLPKSFSFQVPVGAKAYIGSNGGEKADSFIINESNNSVSFYQYIESIRYGVSSTTRVFLPASFAIGYFT